MLTATLDAMHLRLAALLALAASSLIFTACAKDPEPDAGPACTDDTECKGTRTCEHGKCVEPDFESGAATTGGVGGMGASSSAAAGGDGPGTLPPGCLADAKCVYDSDCPDGHHCNDSIPVPQCEQLYCGPEGSLCSEDELCQPGLLCSADKKCAPPSPCSCESLCAEVEPCGFGPTEVCLDYCSQNAELMDCWCALSGTPDLCNQALQCQSP